MRVYYENGKPKFDIPVVEPSTITDEQIILDFGKETLIKGDEKMVVLADRIEFYFKDKKYAEFKTDYVKAKHYKLKQLCNKIFKTKFKLEIEKPMLHILDEELYKMIERNK